MLPENLVTKLPPTKKELLSKLASIDAREKKLAEEIKKDHNLYLSKKLDELDYPAFKRHKYEVLIKD